MDQVVSIKWLLARLYEPDLVIADCRFVLGDPEAGRESYRNEYIPGSVYFDLERDLAGPKGTHGGRHPQPDIAQLAEKIGKSGIDGNTRVVAYDDQGGAMASRFWWLMKYMGHERVYVMEEGFTAWKKAGYPLTSEPPAVKVPRPFQANVQHRLLANMAEVQNKLGCAGTVLLDSREEKRYLGVEEPIDKAAGHIPGALHEFWKNGLHADGRWKSQEEQKSRFHCLDSNREVIVYCGSGVTACPNVLALNEAGFSQVKLYIGSWSDWISYPDNPIETGKE